MNSQAVSHTPEAKPQSRLQLLALLLLNYFTFALITNIPGVLLPFWKDDFNLSSTVISLLGAVFFLAYGVTSLPQGFLLDNIGNKKTFLWGIGLVLAGSVAFALKPVYLVGLFSLFVIGIGVTALQLVGNLLVKKIDDDPSKYSRNLTLAQVFCGIGGAGGGFLIGYLINNLGYQWKSIYYLFAGLAFLVACLVLITNIPESKEEVGYQKPTNQDYIKLAKNPLMLLFALGIFIYVGIEVGVATWISTFLVEKFNASKVDAAKVVSMYWILQSVGRFTGGFVLNYLETPKALVVYALGCLASLLIAVFAPTVLVASVAFVAVGFFTSIMFPSIFSLAVNSFDKRQEGTVAGILCTAIVGGAITTPVIGLISDTSKSLTNGLVVAGLVSFLYIAFLGIKALKSNSKSTKLDTSVPEGAQREALV
jgi:MFS transporter, FHS family, L-fucose permease